MSRATKYLIDGAVTFLVGLALKLFGGGVDVPWVTLPKVGVVVMVVGAVTVVAGLWELARGAAVRRN
ncbi:DUF5708 family protein [Streptomyces sp. CA-294286]|uniref:DUF5708 family protein n=1 Tax=Streptomyces sp. CA-294286 TaxID=3240070 RepID=UPI003D8B9D35